MVDMHFGNNDAGSRINGLKGNKRHGQIIFIDEAHRAGAMNNVAERAGCHGLTKFSDA
jgi:hypothetical protein